MADCSKWQERHLGRQYQAYRAYQVRQTTRATTRARNFPSFLFRHRIGDAELHPLLAVVSCAEISPSTRDEHKSILRAAPHENQSEVSAAAIGPGPLTEPQTPWPVKR